MKSGRTLPRVPGGTSSPLTWCRAPSGRYRAHARASKGFQVPIRALDSAVDGRDSGRPDRRPGLIDVVVMMQDARGSGTVMEVFWRRTPSGNYSRSKVRRRDSRGATWRRPSSPDRYEHPIPPGDGARRGAILRNSTIPVPATRRTAGEASSGHRYSSAGISACQCGSRSFADGLGRTHMIGGQSREFILSNSSISCAGIGLLK